jgi:hypothetical protein
MTFGQGSANFLIDSAQCVEQAILTGLKLFKGEWFLDITAGMPWHQQVIGFGTQALYDQAIQAQIKGTQGVTAIDSYSSFLNRSSRALTVNVKGQSLYGPFSISTTVPVAGGFGVEGFGEGGFGQ